MDSQKMWIPYPSSITDVVEANKSFDACTLRVCYTGENRNKSSISQEAIEKAIPTIYNCPIVCNYNAHEDSIGGHDVEVIRDDDGIRLVNLTDAIGVIPYGAQYKWEDVEDGDTVKHYFCIEGLLWRRSAAYDKIKSDGVTAQSMEIIVNSGSLNDGIFEISDFDFTAFCLLGDGIEPCFEEAALETFSLMEYKKSFSHLMEDFKAEFSKVNTAEAVDINNASVKGGNDSLSIEELMKKYELTQEDITFDTGSMSASELEQAFADIHKKKFDDTDGNSTDSGATPTDGATDDPDTADNEETPATDEAPELDDVKPEQRRNQYALAGQIRDELAHALDAQTVYDEDWGRYVPRYWMRDFDMDAHEVYVEDRTDWKFYGLKFEVNGDAVTIDFGSRVRKKIAFVDFEDGSNVTEFELAADDMNDVKTELKELREYKANCEAAARKAEIDSVFSMFGDLAGNEAFEALKGNVGDMTKEQVEEKCFAIRGKAASAKFALDNDHKPVRLPIERGGKQNDEPYGGVFLKYGIGAR